MTTASAPVSPVGWRDDIRVMSLVGLAHASSHFSHLLLPVMFPVFVREFGWSYAQLGLLSSVFFAVSGTPRVRIVVASIDQPRGRR